MATATHALGHKIWPNLFPQIPHCISVIRKALRTYQRQLTAIHRIAKTKREEFLHALRERIALRKVTMDNLAKTLSNIEKQL